MAASSPQPQGGPGGSTEPNLPRPGAEPRRTRLPGGLQNQKSAFRPRMEPSCPGLSWQCPKSVPSEASCPEGNTGVFQGITQKPPGWIWSLLPTWTFVRGHCRHHHNHGLARLEETLDFFFCCLEACLNHFFTHRQACTPRGPENMGGGLTHSGQSGRSPHISAR